MVQTMEPRGGTCFNFSKFYLKAMIIVLWVYLIWSADCFR